jgi:hypothetical protein
VHEIMNMIKNVNHLLLILQQNDNKRFRAQVKNPSQPLWLFKTWASGDSCIRITNPSIAVRDCKSRTVGDAELGGLLH